MIKHKDNRGYSCIGLIQPKHSINVATIIRAAACYDSTFVATTGHRYHYNAADTEKAHRRLPLLQVSDLKEAIPFDCVPVAVELIDGAIALPEYNHPRSAFYIFGPEDGSLGKSVTDWCRDKIYIPTHSCMNLACTVNVVLYDRMCKQFNKPNPLIEQADNESFSLPG